MSVGKVQACDLLIENCAVLLPDLTVAEQQAIAIQGQRIAAIGPAPDLRRTFSPRGVLDGTDKLAIPGLIDAHTHTAQHLLRGAVIDERPIVWQRILIPFESKLTDEDIYHSARLACLQMARAGITTFGDAGVLEVDGIIRAAGESGLRATISRFTADEHNGLIPTWYADTTSAVIGKTEALFKQYDGTLDGRLRIAFSITGPDNASPGAGRGGGRCGPAVRHDPPHPRRSGRNPALSPALRPAARRVSGCTRRGGPQSAGRPRSSAVGSRGDDAGRTGCQGGALS